MLCESCTIVDKVYLGKLPIGQFNVQIQNPFTVLANQYIIKAAVKAKEVNHNPANGEFLDNENVSYQYVPFPPKFSVQHFTNSIDSNRSKSNMHKLINHSVLFPEIGAIGINYDVYVDNKITKDLKDKILSDKISNQCSGIGSTTLKFKLDDYATLNIMITQDVTLSNSTENVTLFNANIHISTISFEEADFTKSFENNLYSVNTVKEKIKMLLSL